jgi:hypothetical protein
MLATDKHYAKAIMTTKEFCEIDFKVKSRDVDRRQSPAVREANKLVFNFASLHSGKSQEMNQVSFSPM